MERLAGGYREAIEHARLLIPAPIRARVEHAHFLTGVCPNWVGLHPHVKSTTPGTSAWTYSQMAHAGGAHHQRHLPADRRHPTVVLPLALHEMERLYWDDPGLARTIVHELGHILDYSLRWRPEMTPVTAYAAATRWEAFAEAFEFSVFWPDALVERAPEAAVFFEELAA